MNERQDVGLKAFQSDPNVRFYSISKNISYMGGSNSCYNQIMLFGISTNEILEKRTIWRAWHLGQARKVKVLRYVMSDSVEGSIIDLRDQTDGTTRRLNAVELYPVLDVS